MAGDNRAEATEKDQKKLKSDAKELWKLLKQFKVTPSNGDCGPAERALVEGILSGGVPLNPKLVQDISSRWNNLQRWEMTSHRLLKLKSVMAH